MYRVECFMFFFCFCFFSVNGFDLEIKKVRPQDGGDYICQLSTYTPEEQVHTLEILGKSF